jgi:transcriptional regulator with XRE-family HTH domain
MVHLGQNIARLRGMRRMTQKEMAAKLELAQPEYSRIEQKAEIDEDLLALIATALEVTPEAIKNFNENAVFNNFSCNFSEGSANTIYQMNPIEKIIELYEAVIKEKDAMIALLKKQQ